MYISSVLYSIIFALTFHCWLYTLYIIVYVTNKKKLEILIQKQTSISTAKWVTEHKMKVLLSPVPWPDPCRDWGGETPWSWESEGSGENELWSHRPVRQESVAKQILNKRPTCIGEKPLFHNVFYFNERVDFCELNVNVLNVNAVRLVFFLIRELNFLNRKSAYYNDIWRIMWHWRLE